MEGGGGGGRGSRTTEHGQGEGRREGGLHKEQQTHSEQMEFLFGFLLLATNLKKRASLLVVVNHF